jgi:hypothetical protein
MYRLRWRKNMRIRLKGHIPSLVRLQAVSSIIAPKMNLFFLVSLKFFAISLLFKDEVKWGLRMPSRFAGSIFSLNYEKQVQDQINAFIAKEIKHDYLDNRRELNLDLSMREAEFLFRANPTVKAMAESGEL